MSLEDRRLYDQNSATAQADTGTDDKMLRREKTS